MARKRRAPSPAPPPPPPPQESSSETGSDTEEEEDSPRAAASKKQPQSPQLQALAAAANGADSDADTDADLQAFQMRRVTRSPAKPGAPTPQPGTDADEEEKDGESSESEPEVPDPVPKKAAVAKKAKAVEEDKKRAAPEAAPSRKGKKVKAEPPASPTGKGKKAKAEPEKPAPEATPSGKAKKPGGKPEKSGLESTPSSTKSEKSARALRLWSKEDSIKILEALAAHVKSEGRLPKTDILLAAVRDSLDRKDCSYSDLYERVRRLKERYEKTVSKGVLPSEEDELQMHNLAEAVWGEKAKEAIAAAAASQNGSTVTDSKKGQANKEKMDGNSRGDTSKEVVNQNGGTRKGGKKGQAINENPDMDVKRKIFKEDSATGTSNKTKKQGNEKEELGKSVRNGTSNETPTKNGDTLTKRKRGKMVPKEASTDRQNVGSQAEDATHPEEEEIGAAIQGMRRSFDELQNLYPSLAWSVERMAVQHPCGETLKRAFEFIHDDKANAMESKFKKQRISDVKVQVRRLDISKEVLNMLLSPAD